MRRLALSLSVALLLGSASCGDDAAQRARPSCLDRVSSAAEGAYVRVTRRMETVTRVHYADGRVVEVPRDPRRIVSTLPGLTETIAWMGALDRLVAVSKHCNTPAPVLLLPRVAVMPLDAETLVTLKPDLVLIDPVLQPGAAAALERHGLRALPVESRSLGHFRTTLDVLAAVLGTREARTRATRFASRLEGQTAKLRARPGRPLRVLLLAQPDPVYVLGPGSLLDDMVRVAGAINIACDLGRASGPFDEELVLVRAPDVILVLDAGGLPDALRHRWRTVPAVRSGKVTVLSGDDVLRAGPRALKALAQVSRAIHAGRPPERAPEDER